MGEMQRGKGLLAAFRVMEPTSVLVSLARDLGGGTLSLDAQLFFLEKCINDQICRQYPPSRLYMRSALKQVILAAERDGEEVVEALYELHAYYLHLQQDQVSEIAGKCYRTFAYAVPIEARTSLVYNGSAKGSPRVTEGLVTLRVSLNMLEGATGCHTWPASLLLTEFLLCHPQLVSGQNCLELGSGAGMIGVCLSRLAASKIVLTDGDLATLANLRHNLEINDVKILGRECVKSDQGRTPTSTMVDCRQLLWETASEEELHACGAHVILGADLIYDPTTVPHLVRVLAALLSTEISVLRKESQSVKSTREGAGLREQPAGEDLKARPVAYVASAVRNPDTLLLFEESVRREGIEIIDVMDRMQPLRCLPDINGFERSSIRLHRLQAL